MTSLTATPSPGVGFPDGQPTWTSSAGGSFLPTSGPIVTWIPPEGFVSSSVDDVTITAKCGSGDDGETHTLTVVKVERSDSSGSVALSRSESTTLSLVNIEPADFDPNITVSTVAATLISPTVENVSDIVVENLIDSTDAVSYLNSARISIQSALPETIDLGFKEIELEKEIDDFWDAKIGPDGVALKSELSDLLKEEAIDQVKSYLDSVTIDGESFGQTVPQNAGNFVGESVETSVSDLIDLAFENANPPSDKIAEDKEFTWNYNATLTTTFGGGAISVTGTQDGVDLSQSDWVRGIRENGFSSQTFDFIGTSGTLNINANGGNWSGSGSFNVNFSDADGSVSGGGAISIELSF